MTEDVFSPERISFLFKDLTVAAERLNVVSDELGKSISSLDGSLRDLNLGIAAWVTFHKSNDPDTTDYGAESLGYAKVGSKWGIALRLTEGNEAAGRHREAVWLFNDAPRLMRLQGMRHLPQLLEALIQQATATAQEIYQRIEDARKFAEAVSVARKSVPPQKR